MIGALAGDTIGSAYEFHNTRNYDFPLFQDNSEYTDDSIMTMAIAYWLLSDADHTYLKLEDVLVKFGRGFPRPMGGYGGGFAAWLFHPEKLYPFDDKYGAAPYDPRPAAIPMAPGETALPCVSLPSAGALIRWKRRNASPR